MSTYDSQQYNPNVQVTFKAATKKQVIHTCLDVAVEKLVGNIPTESVIAMRHALIDGESWEYDFHSHRGCLHITVEHINHADS